jgi:RraA family protein
VAGARARPDVAVLEQFADLPAAIVGDVLGRMTVLDSRIRLVSTRGRLVGFALPVEVRAGDNLAVHRALDDARRGDVLVVNGRGDTSRAVVGDLVGEIMLSVGMTGVVVDGAVRDVDALSEQGLTVYARAATPAGPFKNGPGSVGVPVAVGGVVISAGDLIVGDRDGVVLVPRDKIDFVLDRVEGIVRNEQELRERIVAARNASVRTP